MKTRLNIFSLLIVLVFVYAAGYEIYLGSTDFRQGFREGYHDSYQKRNSSASDTPGSPYYLKLVLNTEKDMPVDSVYNKATERYCPAEYTAIKFYPKERSIGLEIVSLFCTLFIFFIFPVLVICFWKVIASVKQAKIFDRKNIRRLRIIGLCFSLLAILLGIPEFVMEMEAKKTIVIEGYTIVSGEWFRSSLWIYALISLLVAEIFAIGLRLKEEQDLTI